MISIEYYTELLNHVSETQKVLARPKYTAKIYDQKTKKPSYRYIFLVHGLPNFWTRDLATLENTQFVVSPYSVQITQSESIGGRTNIKYRNHGSSPSYSPTYRGKSTSCNTRSFPAQSYWTIKLLRIISANQIWPEVNVLCRRCISCLFAGAYVVPIIA